MFAGRLSIAALRVLHVGRSLRNAKNIIRGHPQLAVHPTEIVWVVQRERRPVRTRISGLTDTAQQRAR